MEYKVEEIAIIFFSLTIIVYCILFIPDSSGNLILVENYIYTGDNKYANYQMVNKTLLEMDLKDDYQIIELGDSYINVYQENTNNFIDLSNGKIVSFDETLNDLLKDKFYNYFYQELRLKYPKFIADNLYEQGISNYVVQNDAINIYFSNETINPVVNEDLSVKLICKDYQEMIKYDCDETILENPNKVELSSSKKTVAITFDDGPNENTLQVLELLKENNMHATFFQLGPMMRNYPEIVKKVIAEGHEVGSHTYSHSQLNKLGVVKASEELNKVKEIYRSITGQEILLTRPPYGSLSKKVREGTEAIYINWNIDSLDWKYKDTDSILKNIMTDLDDGDIILLHDIYPTTAESLKVLLPLLYSEGYQVVTVSDLARLKGYELETHHIYFSFNSK